MFLHRISAVLSCPMKLQKYPLDVQVCPIKIESCKYPVLFIACDILFIRAFLVQHQLDAGLLPPMFCSSVVRRYVCLSAGHDHESCKNCRADRDAARGRTYENSHKKIGLVDRSRIRIL